MLLLISPDGVDEALDCAKAAEHLDIVDVKKPDEGSLGANYPWVIREIRAAVPADKPVSATVGDVPYKPGTVAQAALGAAVSGATYIKVGLYGCGTPEQAVEVMRGVVRAVKDHRPDAFVVASGYADAHRIGCVNPLALPDIARRSGSDAAMLDTAIKDGTRLFDHVPPDVCAEFVRRAHDAGLLAALAGSVGSGDLGELARIQADIVGVRGAVCEEGTAMRAGSSRTWWQPSGRRWTGTSASARPPRYRADHDLGNQVSIPHPWRPERVLHRRRPVDGRSVRRSSRRATGGTGRGSRPGPCGLARLAGRPGRPHSGVARGGGRRRRGRRRSRPAPHP